MDATSCEPGRVKPYMPCGYRTQASYPWHVTPYLPGDTGTGAVLEDACSPAGLSCACGPHACDCRHVPRITVGGYVEWFCPEHPKHTRDRYSARVRSMRARIGNGPRKLARVSL
jgi:hypothetical protein